MKISVRVLSILSEDESKPYVTLICSLNNQQHVFNKNSSNLRIGIVRALAANLKTASKQFGLILLKKQKPDTLELHVIVKRNSVTISAKTLVLDLKFERIDLARLDTLLNLQSSALLHQILDPRSENYEHNHLKNLKYKGKVRILFILDV